MSSSVSRLVLILIIAACACAPSAPAGPSPQATPAGPQRDENQTLRLALTGIVGNVTPQASASATHQFGWLYDSLTLFGPNFEVRPGVAERWEIGPDGLTWRFFIRRDMTWPDGSPLTAEDVVFTVQQILDRNWPQRAFLGTAVSTRVADTFIVEITTRVPDLSIPNGGPYLYIIPRRYFEANGFEGFRDRPVGSGPYELVEFRQGDLIRFRKRAQPHAFRRPVPDEVIIRAIPEAAQILNGLRAGEIDMVPFGAFTADQADQMRRAGLTVQSFPLANISFSIIQGVNEARQTPLTDRRVRLALNYAVNREAIAASIYRGFAEPVGQYAIPGSLYWDPAVRPLPFNQAEARRLLAEAGYANGFRVTVDWGPMIAQDVVTAVQGMLREVGVEAELRFSEQALLQERIFGRNNQSLGEIYAGGTTDQNGFAATVRTTHGCNRPAGAQPVNVWYCNPEWERVWDSALGERDPQRRAQIMREANRIQREDLWVIFGVLQPVYVVSTNRVGDVNVPFIGAYLLDSAVKLRP